MDQHVTRLTDELGGASVAAVAMAHGLNANLVHKWRRLAAAVGMPSAALPRARNTGNEFIAVALAVQAAPVSPCDIRIELCRGATTIVAAGANMHEFGRFEIADGFPASSRRMGRLQA